uniref:Uncharacterized protein n=1 Tax=Trichogramma kaykai TaxID=54128 RepID=A0ABD2X5K0_9HYME
MRCTKREGKKTVRVRQSECKAQIKEIKKKTTTTITTTTTSTTTNTAEFALDARKLRQRSARRITFDGENSPQPEEEEVLRETEKRKIDEYI